MSLALRGRGGRVMTAAAGNWILFLDNDTVIDRNYLHEAAFILRRRPDVSFFVAAFMVNSKPCRRAGLPILTANWPSSILTKTAGAMEEIRRRSPAGHPHVHPWRNNQGLFPSSSEQSCRRYQPDSVRSRVYGHADRCQPPHTGPLLITLLAPSQFQRPDDAEIPLPDSQSEPIQHICDPLAAAGTPVAGLPSADKKRVSCHLGMGLGPRGRIARALVARAFLGAMQCFVSPPGGRAGHV